MARPKPDIPMLIGLFHSSGTLDVLAEHAGTTPRALIEAWRRLQRAGKLPLERPNGIVPPPPDRPPGWSLDIIDGRPRVSDHRPGGGEPVDEGEDLLLARLYDVHCSPLGTDEYQS